MPICRVTARTGKVLALRPSLWKQPPRRDSSRLGTLPQLQQQSQSHQHHTAHISRHSPTHSRYCQTPIPVHSLAASALSRPPFVWRGAVFFPPPRAGGPVLFFCTYPCPRKGPPPPRQLPDPRPRPQVISTPHRSVQRHALLLEYRLALEISLFLSAH